METRDERRRLMLLFKPLDKQEARCCFFFFCSTLYFSAFKVSFNVSVEARSCPPRGTDQSFTIKPVGFKDRLEVSVDYQCDCGCSRTAQTNSSICSSIGTSDHTQTRFLFTSCEDSNQSRPVTFSPLTPHHQLPFLFLLLNNPTLY